MGRGRIEIPDTGTKLIGLDIGQKKSGIAISDTAKQVAFPLEIFRGDLKQLESHLLETLGNQVKIEGFVLGIPHHIQGEEGEAADRIRTFGEDLSKKFNLPVFFQDERLSSSEAQDLLEPHSASNMRAPQEDHIAAQIILQRFLDQKQGSLSD